MLPPSSAREMLMQVKRYADGGDVSSVGLAKAISSGLTQTQYDDNIRAYIAKTSNPLEALNTASEYGVSMADINRALGKQVAADYFTTDYNTETAPSTNVATGFTSQAAQRYNAPGGLGQARLDAEINKVSKQYAANTPENAQILRDMFIQEGGSIADLQRAGFDPSRLLGTVAKKPTFPTLPIIPAYTPPVVTPETQTQYSQPTQYTATPVYQPLAAPPPIYATGQPALDVAFRNSPARTYDPRYGYVYSPAAKLLPATGAGMSFTPPSVTSRPRSLLNVPLPVSQTPKKKWSEFTPEEQASFGLSVSQVFAREESEKASTSPNRFAGQTAPTEPADSTTDPNAIKPIEFRTFGPLPVKVAKGGPVKKPEGSLAATAPMSHADLLAQIDRSTAATPSAVTPDRDPVKTESAGMLSRLNDAFGRNISQPIVGSAIDMTAGLGDILQMGTKYLANRAGIETQPFTPVSPRIQEAAGTAGYDPYSPAALAASVLLPAAGPLRTAAAATRPMMSMAAPGSARETLSLIGPILDREASVAASAELAAMGAREVAPDNVTAEIAAAIAGGGAYNTLDNILGSASRGPTTSGIIKERGGNWIGEGIDDEMGELRAKNQGIMSDTPAALLGQMYARYTPEAIASLSPELARNVTNSIEGLKAKSQIDTWIDTKLSKYIRNEMGTESDPIRALAERGVLHIDPDQVGMNRYTAVERRNFAGTPRLGSSDAAKAWEDATDVSVIRNTAGSLLDPVAYYSEYLTQFAQDRMYREFLEENPWLTKVAPETKVYDLSRSGGYGTRLIQGLGFDHLIDELNNATRPDTDLPERLRIDYNKLDRMSVPQIVEKVADINTYRAELKTVADLARAQNAATVPFKAYDTVPFTSEPNSRGLGWVELKTPDRTEAQAAQVRKDFPDLERNDPERFNSFVQDALYASRNTDTSLQDALKYEGDTMGHCVGGYCADVAAGATRIYSLRDAKGQPHVTIEVEPVVQGVSGDILNEMEPGIWDKIVADNGHYDSYEWLERNRPDLLDRLNSRPPERIVQIKGKGNKAPVAEYLPFVQDFVKSGQWTEVGDIRNTGLVSIDADSDLAKSLTQKGIAFPAYATQQEISSLLRQAQVGVYSDWRQSGTRIMAEPPPEEFAVGGYITKKTKGA